MHVPFGLLLKEFRLAVGLGQTQFAEMIGMKPSNLRPSSMVGAILPTMPSVSGRLHWPWIWRRLPRNGLNSSIGGS